MAEWINNDGLRIRFDVDKINQGAPRGEAPGAGEDRVVDFIIDVADLTAGEENLIEGVVIPRNSFIAEVWVTTIEAVTGTTAIDLGTQKYDGTELDYDGLLTAFAPPAVGVRTKLVKGDTGAGAVVGTTTALPGDLVVNPTGQGTAGKIGVRVHLFVPGKDVNAGDYV